MPGTLGKAQTILESPVTARRKPSDEYERGALKGEFRARFLGPERAVSPKIAVMNDKGQISRVHFPHYVGKLLFRPLVIRHVSDQREFKSGALNSPFPLNGGAAGKEKHEV